MSEQIISLASYSPVEIYGVNDINLNVLRDLFPKLKIIARGEVMKIIGSEEDIAHFESCFDRLLHAYDTYGVIHPSELNRLISPGFEKSKPGNEGPLKGDVLVYGRNGLMIQPRTENQRKMVKALEKDDMLFAIGPAGTGKTYTAVALAVRALKAREVKRIILT
ncbi:MAG: PhoH family protein, partial [Bacteroidales bacterium]|nr:PhoH family protein [Bacteroidales bacterium]